MSSNNGETLQLPKKKSYWTRMCKDVKKNYQVYLIIIPVIVYSLFCLLDREHFRPI